jgi:hypothetical protein
VAVESILKPPSQLPHWKLQLNCTFLIPERDILLLLLLLLLLLNYYHHYYYKEKTYSYIHTRPWRPLEL